MKLVNYLHRFKSLPLQTKKIMGLGVVIALFVALPLFIWAVVTQTYKVAEKAATGEPGVCFAVNNTITVSPANSPNSTCHDIRAAVEAAANDTRTTIQVAYGDYEVMPVAPGSPILTIDKPITFVGISSSQNIKPRISFRSNGASTIGVFVNKSGVYTDRQEILDGIVAFQNLKLESDLGNESTLIKTENRLITLENSELYYYASGAVNSNSALLYLTQSESYGYPATNNRIENSVIAASQNGFSIKTELSDTTFGVYINRSTLGRIEARGPLNTTAANYPSFWVENSTIYRGIQLMNQIISVRKNLIYGGIGLHANHSRGDIVGNTILYSTDVGLTTTGDLYSAISKNIIMNSSRVGVYITQWPGESVTEFSHNDVFSNGQNYGDENGNPPLLSDQTGINGNISKSPLFGNDYCLPAGSPAIYGNAANGEYMGHKGPCSLIPSPSASPSTRVRVLTPDGGEILNVGENYTIKWSGPGRRSYLIYLVNSLGQTSLISGASASATTFNWNVSSPIMSGTALHKIRVTETGSNPLSDSSNNYFRIRKPASPTATPRVAGECQFCGGIAGIRCGSNLTCQMSRPSFPDQGGICVKTDGSSICVSPSPTVSPTATPQETATPTPAPLTGDVNGDGMVNIVDIGIIVDNYRLSPPVNPEADLNHDGIVNIIDIGIVVDNYQT